ncbi:hypothetical protein ABES80_08915 [Bacillus gobiensis]|uniref:hypothetical protein n=1 Tax=Bacillus gobiensis TaxID=1441095 RepID=UPI003D21A475
MKIHKWKMILLLVILFILLFISTMYNIDLVVNFIPEEVSFILEYKNQFIIISYLLQSFVLITVIIFETFLLFLLVRIILNKSYRLNTYVVSVLITNIVVLILNMVYNEIFFTDTMSIDDFKYHLIVTPVNYLIKPLLMCYLLFQVKILTNKIIDWLIVGGGYLLFTYVPGYILIEFIK